MIQATFFFGEFPHLLPAFLCPPGRLVLEQCLWGLPLWSEQRMALWRRGEGPWRNPMGLWGTLGNFLSSWMMVDMISGKHHVGCWGYMMVDVGWLVLGRFLNIINDLDKQQWGWADARANSARWLRVLDLLKRISWLTKPQMMLRIYSTLRRASKTEAVFFFRMTPYFILIRVILPISSQLLFCTHSCFRHKSMHNLEGLRETSSINAGFTMTTRWGPPRYLSWLTWLSMVYDITILNIT